MGFQSPCSIAPSGFRHCKKFPTATSRRILGRVSILVWLIIFSIRKSDVSSSSSGFLLSLLNLQGISNCFQLLFPSQGQVLKCYSTVCHWKHHFLSFLCLYKDFSFTMCLYMDFSFTVCLYKGFLFTMLLFRSFLLCTSTGASYLLCASIGTFCLICYSSGVSSFVCVLFFQRVMFLFNRSFMIHTCL